MPTDNNDRTTLGATNSPVKTDGGVQSIAEQLGNVPNRPTIFWSHLAVTQMLMKLAPLSA